MSSPPAIALPSTESQVVPCMNVGMGVNVNAAPLLHPASLVCHDNLQHSLVNPQPMCYVSVAGGSMAEPPPPAYHFVPHMQPIQQPFFVLPMPELNDRPAVVEEREAASSSQDPPVLQEQTRTPRRKRRKVNEVERLSSQGIKVRDPMASGRAVYDVPAHHIIRTTGLLEYLNGTDANGPRRCPTLCRLFLENRCRQGVRCKNTHVNVEFVQAARKEHNVHLWNFFAEIPVINPHTNISTAVRYSEIVRTRGLQNFRQATGSDTLRPATVCKYFMQAETCWNKTACRDLHVPSDVLRKTPRTPCCYNHGDSEPMPNGLDRNAQVCVVPSPNLKDLPLPRPWVITWRHVAVTAGLRQVTEKNECLWTISFCSNHLRTSCKFGRDCYKVHVCRTWAAQVGVSSYIADCTGQ